MHSRVTGSPARATKGRSAAGKGAARGREPIAVLERASTRKYVEASVVTAGSIRKQLRGNGILRASVLYQLLEQQGIAFPQGDVLDLGCKRGGFSIQAARAGARVTA